MINSVSVITQYGDRLDIELRNPLSSGFLIESIEGIGPQEAQIYTTPFQAYDGERFNSAVVQKRNITMKIRLIQRFYPDTGYELMEDLRRKAYKFFPVKGKVSLIFFTDKGDRAIDGYVESCDPDIFSKEESISISIICPDPYFYEYDGPGQQIEALSILEPRFFFKFEDYNEFTHGPGEYAPYDEITNNFIEFDYERPNGYTSFTSDGSSLVPIEMTFEFSKSLTGTIKIINGENEETMSIDCSKINTIANGGPKAGDVLYINTKRGEKEVTLTRGTTKYNCISAVGKDSVWHQVAPGDNIFAYTCKNYDAFTLTFTFPTSYVGV